jgi:hypothetical protein
MNRSLRNVFASRRMAYLGCLGALVGVVAPGNAHGQSVTCASCTVGPDGTLLSELDNPRVLTTIPIDNSTWPERGICLNSAFPRVLYTEDFLVQVATTPISTNWDTPISPSADDSRPVTLCDPLSPDGEYLAGQAVPIESAGLALGTTPTTVTWTKRRTTTSCSPTAQNCVDVVSANLSLSDETLLQPIRLVVAYPEGSSPLLGVSEARALFDDYPYANTSNVIRTLIDGQFHVQVSEVQSSPLGEGEIEGQLPPDPIFSQCGVQTRLVAYAAVPVPQELYDGTALVRDNLLGSCLELEGGPSNSEINGFFAGNAPYCPMPFPVGESPSPCPADGVTFGIHVSARDWILATAEVVGWEDPISGDPIAAPTFPNPIDVVVTAHSKPVACGRSLYGFSIGNKVVIAHEDALANGQSTTLAHELYHAMTDSSDHISGITDSLLDQLLMKGGEGNGTAIPGCSTWRAAGSAVPAGCNAARDAQIFAANPNAFGCSMLRNKLGGVIEPPPAPDMGAMEPPPPASPFTFTYGSAPGAPEVEFTNEESTNGDYSVVVPPGWTEVTSPTVLTTSWASVGTELSVDVFIPSVVPNPWWVGAVAFAVDLPAAGFNNAWLGQVDLTSLPRGGWVTVSVPVGPSLEQAILDDYPGLRIRIITNVSTATGFDSVLLDNLRFSGELTERTIFHQTGSQGSPVSSSSLLSFEVSTDWTSAQATLNLNSDDVSDGAFSLSVPAGGTKFVVSRPFTTAELPALGGTLSLDVYVPNPQPNPWWVGDVQVYLTCSSANLYNVWLGQAPLSGLFPNEFNQLTFDLPSNVEAALNGAHSGCHFSLALNSNTGSGAFLFDRLGFLQ